MIICLEGNDASGKATQSKLLAERLPATRFSFPNYESPTGHLILGHLKRYWECAPAGTTPPDAPLPDTNILNALTFQALQLANRMEVASDIMRAQSRGHVVFYRYWPSGMVYGGADGLDPDYLHKLHDYLPQPDIFILLDIGDGVSALRRPERRDRYEEQDDLMREIGQRYRSLWSHQARQQGSHRWAKVDGNGGIEDVYQQIIRAMKVIDPAVA